MQSYQIVHSLASRNSNGPSLGKYESKTSFIEKVVKRHRVKNPYFGLIVLSVHEDLGEKIK